MDEKIYAFLRESGPVLCIDIGSGTQDALLACPDMEFENWPRFVLPSPARTVRGRIAALTAQGLPIWLYGGNMGGGFSVALSKHIKAGYAAYATPDSALAIHDNMDVVRNMGVQLAELCPAACVPVPLADYSAAFWQALLLQCGLPLPHMVLTCAQDHGFHADGNRKGRMQTWRELLESSSDPTQWIYPAPPPSLTRLQALHLATGGPVADTGTCVLLGALSDPAVMARSYREGITIINAGNSHTVAALVYQGKIRGIYEHHTGMRPLSDFLHDLKEFRLSWLPAEEVQATGGHGTAFGPFCEEAAGYTPTYILGPRRDMLQGQGIFLNPHGDMMLAGCFGLLWGWTQSHGTLA